jgi:predicted alpha/beta superfamily hydrolase
VRILLPRGYDVERRSYPVCYWHDGQNMFAKSRPLGHWVEPWGLASAVERLTRAGEITDVIHVAIDQTERRLLDYMPPSDQFDLDDDPASGRPGEADRYLALLREHIHPYVVSHYRVMDDPRTTGMAGSSMGGLITMFSGWNHTDFARRLGVFSASFWAAPMFLHEIEAAAGATGRRPLLFYLDSGTVGPTHDNIDGVMRVRDALIRQGWTLGFDLKHVVGLGDPHNERAWRRRLDDCLRFLYPAGDAFYAEDEELYAERVRGTVWARLEPPRRHDATTGATEEGNGRTGAEPPGDSGSGFQGGGFAF